MKQYPYYLLGKFEHTDSKEKIQNPHTLEEFAEVSLISQDALKNALDHLKENKRELLSTFPIKKRIELLTHWKEEIKRRKEELIEILIKESGKSLHYAEGEINALLKRFEYIEREAELLNPKMIDGELGYGTDNKYALICREPQGMVLCIAPFNYPVLTLMIKVIPAILGGNIVIAKPSLKTPLSAVILAECFDKVAEKIGVDKRMFNVVIGKSSEIGDTLIKHNGIDMISFTGSTKIGKEISSKTQMKKFHAELGGKGTALVLDDAHIEEYAKEICKGAYKFSGQRCDALNRIIVLKDIKDKLIESLKNEVQKWNVSSPQDTKEGIVPLIDTKSADKVEELIKDALDKGATLIHGYERVRENVITPVILDNVNNTMRIYYEEIFGPVITLTSAENIEDAINKALDNTYGLDASIFCSDIVKGVEIAKKLEEGSVTLNAHPTHGIGYFPFGGNKDSGIGREGIKISLEEFTKIKSIIIKR